MPAGIGAVFTLTLSLPNPKAVSITAGDALHSRLELEPRSGLPDR